MVSLVIEVAKLEHMLSHFSMFSNNLTTAKMDYELPHQFTL